MKLSVGIVGLPNVGKSTIFNALLKKQVAEVANYPFCTIEPNVGIIEVPDERLPKLAQIVATEKIVPAVIEFYDIAGLVKGASEGQGLGNKFLSHIRETAAIVHVVRLFDDVNVVHVTNKLNPLDDIQTINNELVLADLTTLQKQKEPKGKASKEETAFYETVQLLKTEMDKGMAARDIALTEEQKESMKTLNLLTMKPVLYVFNVSEAQLENQENTIRQIQKITHDHFIYLNAKLENEVLTFSESEQKEYLKQFRLEETGLNRLIKKSYQILNLISFLTAGEKEVRAWTIKEGTNAQQAAGVIHSDFAKHFIRADVIPYEEFIRLGGWTNAREIGKVQTVGKEYIMKDGDVVEFRVGI